jgi:hypothetical protein
MRKHRVIFVRAHVVSFVLAAISSLVLAGQAQANGELPVEARLTGRIVSQTLCGPTTLCQQTNVSGLSFPFGRITGVLQEQVDLTTGQYTGTGTFTTKTGTLRTESAGQVSAPDAAGRLLFFETHTIVGGTGRFLRSTGRVGVVGTANPAGDVTAFVLGNLVD